MRDTSILIVDDNPDNLRLLYTLLNESGFVVRFATGGKTALASVRAEAPDLILLDIEMPDLSGYAVCRQLKDDPAARDIPVLFISADKDVEAKVRGFEVGGVDYISKPFHVREVLARIDHQLTIHRQREQIETQARRLRELDEVKSRFFAGITHELRTPLMLAQGLVEDVLAGRFGPLPASARDELDRGLLHANRLEDLIEQLLELSKLEVGAVTLDRRTVDFAALLRRVAQAFAPLAERSNVTLNVEAPVTPLLLYVDPEAVVKVVTNLLSNACKHTPEGGRVSIRVIDHDDAVELAVEDTGSGIPAEVLPHIFDRFYHHDHTRNRRRPGSGIGLSLARELVELHEGTITASSVFGKGSTFRVSLPKTPVGRAEGPRDDYPVIRLRGVEAELLSAEPAEVELENDADETTVLVVDDNAEVRRYVRSHLSRDYRIVEAVDGPSALRLARELLPDVVVSDVRMPEMDGITLCRTLKQDSRTDFIPVVLLTVQSEAEARLEGLSAGADDYLGKPFNVAELCARVDNLIEMQRRLRGRNPRKTRPEGFDLLTIRSNDLSPDEVAFLRKLIGTVEKHLDDPDFSVTDLASELAQDRTTLYRWVQRLTDESPSDVIRSIRMQHAAAMLSEEAGTISEIAYAVGFRSVQHFDRCFRSAYDATPTEFIERSSAA